MKKWILSLAILLTTTTSFAALDAMDGQETHGGNIVLAEFWKHHNYITNTLALCPTAQLDDLASMWMNSKKQTLVKTTPRVFIGATSDQEVVASNTPKADPPSIFISESLWPKLTEIEKTKIVMHEVLPILGYVDTSYDYSAQLYKVFLDCLLSKPTHSSLMTVIGKCEEASIENWGHAEMSAMRPITAMSLAAYQHCLPAIVKLEAYGYHFGSCNTDEIPERQDSHLSSAIIGYYPGYVRSDVFMDFLLASKTSYLKAECDPGFAQACKDIKTRSSGLDKPPQKLVALAKKLSCPE
ncbi:hypothetical protein [Bdellovibrio sp. HCB337]|uniref:hypothetical protein n=1 Tax=Bdellovibrio sp. HCB337 TaxID=3394358 RepID=UPI0039A44EFF